MGWNKRGSTGNGEGKASVFQSHFEIMTFSDCKREIFYAATSSQVNFRPKQLSLLWQISWTATLQSWANGAAVVSPFNRLCPPTQMFRECAPATVACCTSTAAGKWGGGSSRDDCEQFRVRSRVGEGESWQQWHQLRSYSPVPAWTCLQESPQIYHSKRSSEHLGRLNGGQAADREVSKKIFLLTSLSCLIAVSP